MEAAKLVSLDTVYSLIGKEGERAMNLIKEVKSARIGDRYYEVQASLRIENFGLS